MQKILITIIVPLLLIINISSALAQYDKNINNRLKALEKKMEKYSDNTRSPLLTILKNAKITGRLHVDAKFYNENDALNDSKHDGIDINRARLGIKGRLSKNFGYKFENDFAGNVSEIKDAYISYDGIKNTQFKIGQFKQAFSLEKLTSSNNITFMDRSVAVDDAPGRSVGFQGATHGKKWQIAAGLFGESAGGNNRSDDSAFSGSVRASYSPINTHCGKLVHLGLSSTLSHNDRTIDEDGTFSDIDKETLYGAEFVLGLKSLSLQGEYIINDTVYSDDNSGTTAHTTNYESYYVQASYFLTGEVRKYNAKLGTFKGVKVKNKFGKGGSGAFELAVRVSQDDKNDYDNSIIVIGGKTNQTTLGVNWYLNNNARLMANYINSRVDKQSKNDDEKYDAFMVRAQLNF